MDAARLTFLVFAVFFVSIILGNYASLISHLLHIKYDWVFELCLVVGQMIFQYPFISHKTSEQQFEYYFNLLMVSFFGALMLLPLLILNKYVPLTDTVNLILTLLICKLSNHAVSISCSFSIAQNTDKGFLQNDYFFLNTN
jgi:K+-transporting ATPase A subunit